MGFSDFNWVPWGSSGFQVSLSCLFTWTIFLFIDGFQWDIQKLRHPNGKGVRSLPKMGIYLDNKGREGLQALEEWVEIIYGWPLKRRHH